MAFVNNNDKRRETARVAFLDYLNKVENECKTLDELDDWAKKLELAEGIVLDLPDMIGNFSDVLSSTAREELKKFYDFPNIYNKESTKASTKFIQQIQKTIEELEGVNTDKSAYHEQSVQQKSNLSFNFSPKILIVVVTIIAISIGSVFFINTNFENTNVGIEDTSSIEITNKKSENRTDIVDIGEETELKPELGSSKDISLLCIDDIKPPSMPTLISPQNNEVVYDVTPELIWNKAEDRCGVDKYMVEISKNGILVVRDKTSQSHYTVNRVLEDGSYVWKVRAIDNAGNAGLFSKIYIFNIRGN